MKYRIFSTSEKAWMGMLAGIRAAKKSVYIEMYIFADDIEGSEFFKSLEDAARGGVKVIAILDVVGSFDPRAFLSLGSIARLREAGAEVLFASFFWQRLHRKVLIIDEGIPEGPHGSYAFIGGVNIGKDYKRWKDLVVEVRGPVVETITRSFARVYRRCGGKGEVAEIKSKVGAIKKAQMWFLDHGMGKRRHTFRKYYEERLGRARESIVLVTPYFFPPRWFIARLHQAILRGVKVEILLPKSTDYRMVNTVNRSYAAVMTEFGASCYFTEGMNHAKAMLVDQGTENAEGIIGSQNLDMLSFNMNIEAGVFFNDPTMVADLAKIIEGWKSEALPAYRKRVGFKWYDIPMAFFLRVAGLVPLE